MPVSAILVTDLPVIRQSERVDFKRCMTKWFWRWRKGLVPRQKEYGALELGTWMHTAMEWRYTNPRYTGYGLREAFDTVSSAALYAAVSDNVPQHQLEKAEKLRELGLGMATGYDRLYDRDPDIRPMGAEIPLEFDIVHSTKVVAIHRLKPDLLYRNPKDEIWLLENKTAKQIGTEHLSIDDQARGYAAMSERALKNAGYLKSNEQVKGVMYNFLRKIMPDERPKNEQGLSLNKNGTVSKTQRTPEFVRYPVVLSRASKLNALNHIAREASMITRMTLALREKRMSPDSLLKTPHKSCPKLCEFFTMCEVEEQGGDIREMQRTAFIQRNPYEYEQDTTEIPVGFDLA